MSFSQCLFAFDFSKYLPLDSIGYRVIGLPIDIYSVVSDIATYLTSGILKSEFAYKSIEVISLKAV